MNRFLLAGLSVGVCLAFTHCSQPSNPPTNQPSAVSPSAASAGNVIETDPALRDILPADARIEKLAGGFAFTEGPVWINEGYALIRDIPNNAIMNWPRDGKE